MTHQGGKSRLCLQWPVWTQDGRPPAPRPGPARHRAARRGDPLAIDAALKALAATAARKAQVVEMRYYGGFSVAETAEALSVLVETVARDWRIAKLWLLRELQGLRHAGPDDRQPSPQ